MHESSPSTVKSAAERDAAWAAAERGLTGRTRRRYIERAIAAAARRAAR